MRNKDVPSAQSSGQTVISRPLAMVGKCRDDSTVVNSAYLWVGVGVILFSGAEVANL
jgi:hypothetical protein